MRAAPPSLSERSYTPARTVKEKKTTTRKRKRALDDDHTPRPKNLAPAQLNTHGLTVYVNSQNGNSPFRVITLPMVKTKQALKETSSEEHELFGHDTLSVRYTIHPQNAWETMRRYRKFTVGDHAIGTNVSVQNGEFVLVKYDDSAAEGAILEDDRQSWKAKVLDVRAIDSGHVYLLVAWVYRPEDLPSGRKDYHGKHELVATNHLDVIDALTVNGRLDLGRWDESSASSLASGQYFWRQTYDAAYTRNFSSLVSICIDEAPQNPDELIVECDNKDCSVWMHARCIADDAVRSAHSTLRTSKGVKKSQHMIAASSSLAIVPSRKAGLVPAYTARYEGFTADLYIDNGLSDQDEPPLRLFDEESLANRIVITDPDGKHETLPVRCLLCETIIS